MRIMFDIFELVNLVTNNEAEKGWPRLLKVIEVVL